MNNIYLLLKREFLTRVKSKSFLLTTFLAPIGMFLLYAFMFFLMTRGSDKTKNIAIIDNAGLTNVEEKTKGNLVFDYSFTNVATALDKYKAGDLNGVIELPPLDTLAKAYSIIFHSDEQLAMDEASNVERMFRQKIRDFKIMALGIDRSQLDLLSTDLTLEPKTVLNKEKEVSSMTGKVTSVVGLVVGMLLFMMIMVYGNQVMYSVTEEKTNRIVEVLMSSVKPFQLMMGKILGVGAIGFFQVVIWVIFGFILFALGGYIMSSFFDVSIDQIVNNNYESLNEVMATSNVQLNEKTHQIIKEIFNLDWVLIVPLFILYFLIGYLLYSALFAAIGASIGDDIRDAQVLVMIATIPLVISFYIAISTFTAPHSTLSVWSSIAPFSGPIVMPVRLFSEPPTWQLGLSILLNIASVVFLVWLAGRIYRVGILMYGKKASIKEFTKWMIKG